MTKIHSVGVACPHCLGKVYQARTAMGIMFRCDDCCSDWFEDVLRKSPESDDAVDPVDGVVTK